ncbi:cysteine hydrolase family protein [Moritella sp. 28]|uniref:cysteine hydrolase family protein n=1 Tax=Moritella sp. 28 TaxID=2746232 RepID=UPI001BADF061|nr:cysteine hydrolase family protein [Moritella sp. 28]QUM84907.1 cysteine hydrolase [Moritella sp. 28]
MKSAVLVIDVQSTLFDPEPQPFESQVVLNKINDVTKLARAKSVPVIFIQHEQPDTVMEHGSEGWALQSNLVTQSGDHFVCKTTPDSFLNTSLQSLLKELDVDSLIVCGYASEFCIDTSVRRAAGLGYPVTVVSDAHTTHDKAHASGAQIRAHHNATLPNISSFGVKIVAVEADSLWA